MKICSCTSSRRKHGYKTYRQAVKVALKRSSDAGPLRVYKCPTTPRVYHLTSMVDTTHLSWKSAKEAV